MDRDKLFKQDQDINNFAYMFFLKRYNNAYVFKCKWWNWAPPFLFVQFGGLKVKVNDAQSSLSTRLLQNIITPYINVLKTNLIPSESLGLFFHHP